MRRIGTLEKRAEAKFFEMETTWWRNYINADPVKQTEWEWIMDRMIDNEEFFATQEFVYQTNPNLKLFEGIALLETKDPEFKQRASAFLDQAHQDGWPFFNRLIADGIFTLNPDQEEVTNEQEQTQNTGKDSQ
jgi:hypothetical protein